MVHRFHRELGRYFEQSKAAAGDQRAARLLHLMSRHERFLETAVEKYKDDGAGGVLGTWLQFTPDRALRHTLEEKLPRADMTLDEAIECALEWDRALLAAYRQLASATSAPRVQELFHSLLEMEEAKRAEYSRSLLELEHEAT